MAKGRAQYEQFFREADTDGSGTLGESEFRAVIGPKIGFDEKLLGKFFRAADLSGDKKVTLEEFLQAMDQLPEADHKEAMFRRAFNEFDVDGSGYIDNKELKAVLGSVADDCSEAQLDRLRNVYDTDKDGKFEYEEFIKQFFNQ